MKFQHGTKSTTCCLSQTQKIQKQNYKPDIIIAIARGGLIPARILTDLLETQELGYIQIEFYKDINKTRQEPILKQNLNQSGTWQKNIAGRRHRRHRKKPKTRQNPPPTTRRQPNQNSHSISKTPILNNS